MPDEKRDGVDDYEEQLRRKNVESLGYQAWAERERRKAEASGGDPNIEIAHIKRATYFNRRAREADAEAGRILDRWERKAADDWDRWGRWHDSSSALVRYGSFAARGFGVMFGWIGVMFRWIGRVFRWLAGGEW